MGVRVPASYHHQDGVTGNCSANLFNRLSHTHTERRVVTTANNHLNLPACWEMHFPRSRKDRLRARVTALYIVQCHERIQ
jgi:hypothetical protein